MKRRLRIGLLSVAIIGVASPSLPARDSGTRITYGPYSIEWPAKPSLAYQSPGQGGAAFETLALTLAPITFTFSYLRFQSPQMTVGARDFARNMTNGHADAQILDASNGQLKGSSVANAVYRIGDTTTIAYSVQPTPFLKLCVHGCRARQPCTESACAGLL